MERTGESRDIVSDAEPDNGSNNDHLPKMPTAASSSAYNDRPHILFMKHMPAKLQEDNIDILIIHAEKDMEGAKNVKWFIEQRVNFDSHGEIRCPRVKLLDEVICDESPDPLDLAFEKALFVLLYVTEAYCEETWPLQQGRACLKEALHNNEKKWCVIPVHTASKENRKYKLPMMLNSLRHLDYWTGKEDSFCREIRKFLESKIGQLLKNDLVLDEKRRHYYEENKQSLQKAFSYRKSVSCPSMITYASQLSRGDTSSADAGHTHHIDSDNSGMLPSETQAPTLTHFSLPNLHGDKAVPDELPSAVQDRNDQLDIADTLTVHSSLEVNGVEPQTAQREVMQHPVSSDTDFRRRHAQQSQRNLTTVMNMPLEQESSASAQSNCHANVTADRSFLSPQHRTGVSQISPTAGLLWRSQTGAAIHSSPMDDRSGSSNSAHERLFIQARSQQGMSANVGRQPVEIERAVSSQQDEQPLHEERSPSSGRSSSAESGDSGRDQSSAAPLPAASDSGDRGLGLGTLTIGSAFINSTVHIYGNLGDMGRNDDSNIL